jgi:hypothetical protein
MLEYIIYYECTHIFLSNTRFHVHLYIPIYNNVSRKFSLFNWYIYVVLKVRVGTTNYTVRCAEHAIFRYSYTRFLTPTY